jgi:phage baseplate assembly protein V
MVLKAIVRGVNDGNNIQLVHVTMLAGEEDSKVERVQNYGFTSSPPVNGEAIILAVGGDRDHPIAIAVDSGADRKRGLVNGEVAMYHKDGAYTLFKSDGTIEIKADGKDVKIIGGTVIADASSVKLGGTTGLQKLIDKRLEAAYNAHVHTGGTIPPNGWTGPPTIGIGDTPPAIPVSTSNTEAK